MFFWLQSMSAGSAWNYRENVPVTHAPPICCPAPIQSRFLAVSPHIHILLCSLNQMHPPTFRCDEFLFGMLLISIELKVHVWYTA